MGRYHTDAHGDNSRYSIAKPFAAANRLKCRLDDCGDLIIRGKHGDICDYSSGRLLACFYGNGAEDFSRTRACRIRRTTVLGHGKRVQGGAGGDEATFVFDPADSCTAAWFIHSLEIRPKRKATPAMLAHLAQMRARARVKKKPLAEAFQPLQTTAGPSSICGTSQLENRA